MIATPAAMRLPQLGCHTQGRQWGGSS